MSLVLEQRFAEYIILVFRMTSVKIWQCHLKAAAISKV